MNPSSTYNFPWDLISSSFSGDLSKEEELQLQKWLASNPDHQRKYQQLHEMWCNSLDDYKLYQMANETKAWDALQSKLQQHDDAKVISLKTGQTRQIVYRIASVAAVLLLLFGGGFWYISSRDKTIVYETASSEQRNIKLTDGTAIALNPVTKIEILHGYNKKNRTVKMISGEASFSIQHRNDLPFVVDMGNVNVKDIGTEFTIKRNENLIKVTVMRGTVAFNKPSTKETRELTTGMSLTYNISDGNFDKTRKDSLGTNVNNTMLNFDETPLSEVIILVQKKYNKSIRLQSANMANKKLTAHLEGIDYNSALEVICKSLNLEYSVKDSIYLIREKPNE